MVSELKERTVSLARVGPIGRQGGETNANVDSAAQDRVSMPNPYQEPGPGFSDEEHNAVPRFSRAPGLSKVDRQRSLEAKRARADLLRRHGFPTVWKAIRAKCLDCSGADGAHWVRDCHLTDCSLWPYRMGRRPRPDDLLVAEINPHGDVVGHHPYGQTKTESHGNTNEERRVQ